MNSSRKKRGQRLVPHSGMRDEEEREKEKEEKKGVIYGCSSFFLRDIRFFLAASIS